MDATFYAARMAALETQSLYWAFACLFLVIAAFCALYWQQLRIQSLQEENADHIAVIEAHAMEASKMRAQFDQLQRGKTLSITTHEWRQAAGDVERNLSASARYGEPCEGCR